MKGDVAAVIELLSTGRELEFVRAFEHGAGDTSLALLDGQPIVVKAWATDQEREQILTTGLANARIMVARSVPIPHLLERGTVGDYSYLFYEFVEGAWPSQVDDSLADQMLAVIDLQRDAAPRADPDWARRLGTMITEGDPYLDIRPERLRGHPSGAAILRTARGALEDCNPRHLRCTDIVHGDFAPENLLVKDGRIRAVVDWEQSRTGDVGFDLAGMMYDIELGHKATLSALAGLYRAIESQVPPDAWRLYTSIYAVRYASWALNTDMETDVVRTINTLTAPR